MNNNNVYAYLLLGAVVLAGLGGFMFADMNMSSEPTPTITGPTSYTTTMAITIESPDDLINTEGGDEDNGQTE
jgi:hypothetical protein